MTASIKSSESKTGVAATTVASDSISWAVGDVVFVYTNVRDSADNLDTVTHTGSGLSITDASTIGTVAQSRTRSNLFWGQATGASSGVITANFTAAVDSAEVFFVVVEGTHASAPEDNTPTTAIGTDATATVSYTVANTNTLVLGFGGLSAVSQTFTNGTGYSDITGCVNISAGAGGNVSVASGEQQAFATTGAKTVDFAISGSVDWTIIAFGIREAAAASDVLNRGLSNVEAGVIASGGGGHSGLHPIERGFVS